MVSRGISRYLKVSQGISRPRNGPKGTRELEIEYLIPSRYQGIKVSRYLKDRNGSKGAGDLEIEHLKVSQSISRLGTAQRS